MKKTFSRVKNIKIHAFYFENCSNNPNKTFCDFADLSVLKTEKSVQKLNGFRVKLTRDISDSEMVALIGYGKLNKNDNSLQRTKRWSKSYLYNFENFQFIKLLSGLFFYAVSSNDYYFNAMKFELDSDMTQNLKNGHLFTEGQENENRVCQGNSGGPVFVKRGNEFILVAVIHATLGNSSENICEYKKGIHMIIGSYLNWIHQEVSRNGNTVSLLCINKFIIYLLI